MINKWEFKQIVTQIISKNKITIKHEGNKQYNKLELG